MNVESLDLGFNTVSSLRVRHAHDNAILWVLSHNNLLLTAL